MTSRRHLLAAALAAAFTVLAVLVATNVAHGLDQYAVDHWMTSVETVPPRPVLENLVPFRHAHGAADWIAGIVTLLGHPAVSLALVVVLARRFRARREVLVGAFLVGVGIELVLKHTVTRDRLYYHGFHLAGLDGAYPSGHALRSTFVLLLAAALWPRARPWLAVWCAAIAVALVVDGWHTPTDVAGGILLAAVLFLLAARQPVTESVPSAVSSTSRSRSD